MATIAPTQDTVQIALRTFLKAIFPADVEVIIGQDNRVPEPRGRFAMMTPLRITRLRTNIETEADVRFTASIAGNVMTVTFGDDDFGVINIGALVFGTDVAAGTTVFAQLTGPTGGDGTYTVTGTQTISTETMATGALGLEQGAQMMVQIDFHTEDNTAADLAQITSTILRSATGVQMFEDQALGVVPLYADDPRQAPFTNENQQVEWRWIVEANFQINQVASVPQQYMDAADIVLVSVDAEYPPA